MANKINHLLQEFVLSPQPDPDPVLIEVSPYPRPIFPNPPRPKFPRPVDPPRIEELEPELLADPATPLITTTFCGAPKLAVFPLPAINPWFPDPTRLASLPLSV
jgi:hypothetical protein